MLLNNRYLLQDHIVHGSTSTTYRGLDTHTNQGVSIIVLREKHEDDPKYVRFFQREARALSSSHHLNNVRVSNYGQCDGQYFLVIELIEDAHVIKTVSELLTKNLH